MARQKRLWSRAFLFRYPMGRPCMRRLLFLGALGAAFGLAAAAVSVAQGQPAASGAPAAELQRAGSGEQRPLGRLDDQRPPGQPDDEGGAGEGPARAPDLRRPRPDQGHEHPPDLAVPAGQHRCGQAGADPDRPAGVRIRRRRAGRGLGRSGGRLERARRATIGSPPTLGLGRKSRGLLERVAQRKQRALVKRAADQLQPEREPLRVQAGRHAHARAGPPGSLSP